MQKYLIYILSTVLVIETLLLAMLITERRVAIGRIDLLEQANGYCQVALEKSNQLERLRERLEGAYRRVLGNVMLQLRHTGGKGVVEEVVNSYHRCLEGMGGPE